MIRYPGRRSWNERVILGVAEDGHVAVLTIKLEVEVLDVYGTDIDDVKLVPVGGGRPVGIPATDRIVVFKNPVADKDMRGFIARAERT